MTEKYDSFWKLESPEKKFYPVVHVKDNKQARVNTKIALENGADGVFLINHDHGTAHLMSIYRDVREKFSDAFIGLNLLGLSAIDALQEVIDEDDVSALWVDDSGIDDGDEITDCAHLVSKWLQNPGLYGYYFGSVAFKGQNFHGNSAKAAVNASKLCHVVVTSGKATGSAPAVEKLRLMKEAIPNHPLFNASGTTLGNVDSFLPYTDGFMVATGINLHGDFYNFDPDLVKAMADKIHSYQT